MKAKNTTVAHSNKSILYITLGTGAILMIPAVMMQISSEWDWKLFDFIAIGTLLFCAGLFFDFLSRKYKEHKLLIGIMVFLVTAYIYAELAVGIFTNIGS